jgi:exosome complex component RRP41
MSRLELVSPEGLRLDGRRPMELRRCSSQIGFLKADGSCLLELGNTRIICSIHGPKQGKQSKNCSINVTIHKNRKDSGLVEMATQIKYLFESIVMVDLYPKSDIDVFIQVIQSDGGLLHSCINATCLAMIDAGIPMKDYVVACSAGYCNDTCIIDVNYIEESAQVPCLTSCFLPKSNTMTLLNLEYRLHLDHFEAVLQASQQGCIEMSAYMDSTIRSLL